MPSSVNETHDPARRSFVPLALANGEKRSFLHDGDEVIFRGFCAKPGQARIGFGECRALVPPADQGACA